MPSARTTWPIAFALALPCALGLGCKKTRTIDARKAAATFDRVTLDTHGIHGLSGLAVDGSGALWTPAERGGCAFRVELDGARVKTIAKIPVTGVAEGEDLEAMGWAAGDTFWIGTEGRERGVARAYRLHLHDGALVVDDTVAFTSAEAGVEIGANHGAEGLCAAGDTLAVALETAGHDDRGRWAPVITVDGAGHHTGYRVRLTTATGKLSALDCWRDGDAADAPLQAIAIERHFEVTRVLRFTLAPGGGEVTPTVLRDLGPVLRGALNLEGLARLPDGRIVAAVDNQYRTITGPDELLVFKDLDLPRQ